MRAIDYEKSYLVKLKIAIINLDSLIFGLKWNLFISLIIQERPLQRLLLRQGKGELQSSAYRGAKPLRWLLAYSGSVHQYRSHTAHFGRVHNTEGGHIDDVLLLVMLGPRSYTGETVVEIQCHGGSLITRRVLEAVLQAGARAALPGEFTFSRFSQWKGLAPSRSSSILDRGKK